MDLAEFLLARIAEDERVARGARGLHGIDTPWYQAGNLAERGLTRADSQFVEHMDPARVLAECDAKRRIAERAAEVSSDHINFDRAAGSFADDVLELLALPYADHPDYRPEWKP